MKNRIKALVNSGAPTVIRGRCPFCRAWLEVPRGSADMTTCSGPCERRFKAARDGSYAVEIFPSLTEEAELEEWERVARDQHDHPEFYLPCWSRACDDGMDTARIRGKLVILGICSECDGHGKVLKP